MTKKKICIVLSSALLLPMMMSCTPDDEFIRSNGQMGLLGFSVGVADDNESSATRSESYVVDTFVLDGDTLSLVCTETDLGAPAPETEETSDTRGVPIYTREGTSPLYNLQTVYGYFNVSGYKVDADGNLSDFTENYVGTDGQTVTSTTPYKNIPYVFDGETYGYETSGGTKTGWEYWSPATTSTADHFYWWRDKVNPENHYKLAFYAYSPTSSVADPYKWTPTNMVHSKNGVITFDYTVPKAVSGYSNKDAEVQPDILVGATLPTLRDDLEKKTINGTEHYIVPLKFFHALCGVRFKATKEELAKNESGLVINYVTLSGFKNSGTCTFTLGTPTSGKSADKISWASFETSNSGSYTQEFTYTVPKYADFNDAKDKNDATIYGAEEGSGASKNFMLIPQSYGKSGSNAPDAKLTINYTFHGATKTKEVALLPSTATEAYTWKAGKLYTYSIRKIANEVDVAVVETFSASDKTKSSVKVHNTGTVNAYIRVAVIANWVKTDTNGNEIVIAPLTFSDASQCTFTDGFNTDKWIPGTDGYYYYYKVVEPDKTTKEDLFKSPLVAKTSPADPTDAYLKVVILTQGLPANNATDQSDAATKWSVATSYIADYTNIEY